jgi:hypothetical protein
LAVSSAQTTIGKSSKSSKSGKSGKQRRRESAPAITAQSASMDEQPPGIESSRHLSEVRDVRAVHSSMAKITVQIRRE